MEFSETGLAVWVFCGFVLAAVFAMLCRGFGKSTEMNPEFQYLVTTVRKMRPQASMIDRCNLTILLEPGFEDLGLFLARHRVEIVASLPCYEPENVDRQRGDGVFDNSILALQNLNRLGYGQGSSLPLNLVYNPLGASLPPDQNELERDFKRSLEREFGIVFNRLYTITNMPIARFLSQLIREGKSELYHQLLVDSFNPASVSGLMCRDTISVDWRGYAYDCDFNQMLELPMGRSRRRFLWEIDPDSLMAEPISIGKHCFGCTAGSGSSCRGALSP